MTDPRKLTPETAITCKQALVALSRIEPDGMSRAALMDLAQTGVGRLLTTREKDLAFFEMKDRGWITPHTNPITGMETWSLTHNGANAIPLL